MQARILISGRPGCGKSTLIEQLIKELKAKGKKIAGIVTPEIRKGKAREGFAIVDLATRKQAILASVKQKEGPRVSKYKVNIAGIKEIVGEFDKSLNKADIIIIDEIGKMELSSKEFQDMLEKIFASNKPLIATLHRAYVSQYKNKGKLIWLERNKLEVVKEKILQQIKNG